MERILKMRERQTRIASREGRVESDRSREKLLRLSIAGARKVVHAGEPQMVRLPRIERGRRHEQRPVAFYDVNFRIKTRDDPRGQQRRRRKGIDGIAAE